MEEAMTAEATQPLAAEPITVKEFFETVSPGRNMAVKALSEKKLGTHGVSYSFLLPVLELHCTTESCNGVRFFEPLEQEWLKPEHLTRHFITFRCRNCKASTKVYAVQAYLNDDCSGELVKFGERPLFGSPTPARVVAILGAEKEYYFKGRRAENQGLGIAAFAYYRRVVENQKNKIL